VPVNDMTMFRVPLVAGAVLGASAVALGAFGAHWLRDAVTHWGLESAEQSRRIEVWEVAVRYQMYHALVLLLVGLFTKDYPAWQSLHVATWLFIVGVVIFSGCLYALVVTGVKLLGAIVPIGGASLIAGWIVLAYFAIRHVPRHL
jgi:uncharacterized membrane protein YgdD (TMEM256/DUF423 family)